MVGPWLDCHFALHQPNGGGKSHYRSIAKSYVVVFFGNMCWIKVRDLDPKAGWLLAIEHGHLQLIYPSKMVIFNSYVSLPEGKAKPYVIAKGDPQLHDHHKQWPHRRLGGFEKNGERCRWWLVLNLTIQQLWYDPEFMAYIPQKIWLQIHV